MILLAILTLTLAASSLQAQQVADLAPQYRIRNVGGSCGHATTGMALRWLQLESLGDRWWGTYRGGENFGRHCNRLRRHGIKFIYTTDGDVELLNYAAKSRRGAILYFPPGHIVFFAGYKDGMAVILDNNRIRQHEFHEWNRLVQRWIANGGEAIVITDGSPPPQYPV